MRLLRRRHQERERDARLWRRDIHRFILNDRGIAISEVARELGLTYEQARGYFTDGGSEAMADAVDGAIDAISERRGLTPPHVVGTEEAHFIPRLVLQDLMKAPGGDV